MSVENLSPTVTVVDGDVVYPTLFDEGYTPDEIDAVYTTEAGDAVDRLREVEVEKWMKRQRSASFYKRNAALKGAVKKAGRSNQSWGAAMLDVQGRASHIRGHQTAETRSLRQERSAKKLAELACRICPLRDFCSMTPESLVKELSVIGKAGQGTRRRFTDRLKGGGQQAFCKDNLKPPTKKFRNN